MSQHFEFQIQTEEAGERLDVFLAARLGGLSRMRIANLLATQACLVNRQPQPAGYHIRQGDFIALTLADDLPSGMNPEPLPLEVIYEDEHLVVIVKPSGMLVHPTRNTKSGTLLNALAYHFNKEVFADHSAVVAIPLLIRPGLVHRLDRATSGLMVVAKTQRALSILTKHFHKRKVEKRYLAVVEGLVTEEVGTIVAPIGQDESRRPPRWIREDGQYAETRFRVLERLNTATLLEFEPVTGRTNQLRIHAAYLGHAIVGDEIYGSAVSRWPSAAGTRAELPEATISVPQSNEIFTDSCWLPTAGYRLCLHASELRFHHPASGEWLTFASPLPEAIEKIWRSLKNAGS